MKVRKLPGTLLSESEFPACPYCYTGERVYRVVPDRLTASPWQCGICGTIFGTDETDSGLLKQHERPPFGKVFASSPSNCYRCGREISEDEPNRIFTAQGHVCGDCLTLEELREI